MNMFKMSMCAFSLLMTSPCFVHAMDENFDENTVPTTPPTSPASLIRKSICVPVQVERAEREAARRADEISGRNKRSLDVLYEGSEVDAANQDDAQRVTDQYALLLEGHMPFSDFHSALAANRQALQRRMEKR
jgi:hypothetical protein